MRIRKDDQVKVISGSLKGKVAKVVSVHPREGLVKLEGLNIRKRYVKPNMLNRAGGVKDVHVGIDVSKVALVHPTDTKKVTRVGYKLSKDGSKVRVAKQAGSKEIK